ncbi:MAG: 50S ribosomal protein L21 [Bacteroidetes bacterium]|jgi:large subunit ribosomal protein L21|nr:50S ribosomal protein L21 [Bacteroidota bacterium]
MYAIVEIAGQQFKVAKDQKLFVHRLADKEGSKVTFDKVLLLDDGKKVNVGAPAITGASVEAKVLQHLKGDKVIVFKKKRRKGYRVKNGHRQYLTELVIENISEKGAAKKATPKAADAQPTAEAPKKATAKKPAAKKTATKTAEKAPAKKAPAKKAAAKKPAAKKTDSKK